MNCPNHSVPKILTAVSLAPGLAKLNLRFRSVLDDGRAFSRSLSAIVGLRFPHPANNHNMCRSTFHVLFCLTSVILMALASPLKAPLLGIVINDLFCHIFEMLNNLI
jgi:hypothetical protein